MGRPSEQTGRRGPRSPGGAWRLAGGSLFGQDSRTNDARDNRFDASPYYSIGQSRELISQMLTSWFAEHYNDPSLVVYIEPARPRDTESRRADLEQLAKHGCVTINELRQAHGFDPVPWGNEAITIGQPTEAVDQPGEKGAGVNGQVFSRESRHERQGTLKLG
jgi:hypothetical protein